MSSFIAKCFAVKHPPKKYGNSGNFFGGLRFLGLFNPTDPNMFWTGFHNRILGMNWNLFLLRGNAVRLERDRFFVDIFFVGLRKNDLD